MFSNQVHIKTQSNRKISCTDTLFKGGWPGVYITRFPCKLSQKKPFLEVSIYYLQVNRNTIHLFNIQSMFRYQLKKVGTSPSQLLVSMIKSTFRKDQKTLTSFFFLIHSDSGPNIKGIYSNFCSKIFYWNFRVLIRVK